MSGIYDAPEIYALACSFRDVTVEVDALSRWAARHGRQPVRRVLELAAGPAEHAREFVRRGMAATAVDRSPAMCRYAEAAARAEGLALCVLPGDMRDLVLADPVDLAVTMLDSVCHLPTLDDMLAHLRAVRASLVEGALYVIEMAHPADLVGPGSTVAHQWEVSRPGVRAWVRWGGDGDVIDPVTQITRERVRVRVERDGRTTEITDEVAHRAWSATEMEAVIRLAGGWRIAARYGDFAADLPLDAPNAWRMILVLRREAG